MASRPSEPRWKYLNQTAFSPDGKYLVKCGGNFFGEPALQVVPGGKLGYDAAEPRMDRRLRVHHVAQDATAGTLPGGFLDRHHRRGRLVAARLDPEYPHRGPL